VGPLDGVTVLEIASRGPGPFAGMMLADMGAQVVRVDRPPAAGADTPPDATLELVNRGRRSIALDLRRPAGGDVVRALARRSDAMIEGFRPGVAERLAIGPDECLAGNPALVYGRATGWGQTGPLAHQPGHDINYIALSGALGAIGRAQAPPTPPLNLVGDNAGGMLLAFGVLCGVLAARDGRGGQVIDAAMIDASALLMTIFFGRRAMGLWRDERGANLLDSGYPLYDVYRTRDGQFISIGAIEPQFRETALRALSIELDDLGRTRQAWPAIRRRLANRIGELTREQCDTLLGASETCYAPVLTMEDAPGHPHNLARGTFVEVDGVIQPAPAPRFSSTPAAGPGAPWRPGAAGVEILEELGYTSAEIEVLRDDGALY